MREKWYETGSERRINKAGQKRPWKKLLLKCVTENCLENIPKTTLFRRAKKVGDPNIVSQKGLGFYKPVFNKKQEEDLVDYLLFMENRFFGLTAKDFRQLSFQFATRNRIEHPFYADLGMAGEDFVSGFMKRHYRLSLRSPEATSAARASGFNRVVVADFFKLLGSLYDKYHFSPSRIYNCDETGITTVPNKMSKIMSLKGKKQVGALTSAERGTLVTAEICFNALGNYIPPLLVFPRKKVNPLFEAGTPPETQVVCHPSSWMQSDIFAQKWFNHFLHHTKPTVDDPVLLIFDGHATHTKNIELIEMARENYVHLLVIPPHSSHRMQPRDVSFMAPLNTYYEQEVRKWLRNHPGKVITIYQLGALFGAAYRRSTSTSTAINGFAKTGICPLNPDIFPEHMFAPAETTDKPMPRVDPTPGTSDSNDDTEQTTDPESNNQITPDPLLAVHIPIALPTAVRQGSSAIVTPNLQTDPGPSRASQRTQTNQPAKSLSQDQPISKICNTIRYNKFSFLMGIFVVFVY